MSAEPRSAVLPPLRRSGVALGLSRTQLALVAGAIVVVVLANVTGGLPRVLGAVWLWAPLLVLGAGSWRGRSLVERISVEALFVARRAAGRTRARVDVGAVRSESRLEVPGAVGQRVHLLELAGTRFPGACMVWDAALGTATAVVRVSSRAWHLAAPGDQDQRIAAFSRACRDLATLEGVVRVVTYARTIPRTPDHLHIPEGVGFAAQEHAELVDGGLLGAVPYRDVLVAITLDRQAVRSQVKAAGGGLAGVSTVLAARVATLTASLRTAGVELADASWLSGDGVRGACRLAFDPLAATWLDPRDGIPADYVAVTSLVEHRDHLVVDSALARTWWVERWPNEAIGPGFLEPVIATGAFWHTVAQVWEPATVRASQKRLDNDAGSLETVERLNAALKREPTAAQERERQALARRRADLVAGYGDVRYRAYITALAGETTGLDAVERWLAQALPGVGLNPLRSQQWAAFAQAALPLALPSRGG